MTLCGNSLDSLRHRHSVRFLRALGLFCCPGCVCFCPPGSVVVPVFAGDRHTCSASPSACVFKAAAPAHQCRFVLLPEWYQDLERLFPMCLELCLMSVFFLLPRSPHPPEKSPSSGSRTRHSGARLQRFWTFNASLCSQFFPPSERFLFALLYAQLKGCFLILNYCLLSAFGF